MSCPPPSQTTAQQEAIDRILRLSQSELKQLLWAAGGESVFEFEFVESGLELHCYLPTALRSQLVCDQIERLKGAIAHTCPATTLLINSPAARSLAIDLSSADESLIDESQTLEQRLQFKERLRLEAHCHAAMMATQAIVCVTDRQGWYLNCNFTKPTFGIDRLDAIGALVDEVFPRLATLAHDQLEEAFRYTEIPIYREFSHSLAPGIVSQFRARMIAYGREALTVITPIGAQPWLS